MGKPLSEAFPAARETFQEADDLLGASLTRIMWDGPEEELTLSSNAQPAILAHSVAVLRVVQDRLGPVGMAAGHSLGEFSAHVAAGTLSFADALRTVRRRGELMLEAGAERPGTMAAVLGMDDEAVELLCAEATEGEDSVVVPANFNSPGQVVISGDVEAVARAMEMGSEAGAKKVVPLKVSGAFHSPLMAPAQGGLRKELEASSLSAPGFPVYSNVSAGPVRTELALDLLVQQLTSPVRWTGSVSAMVRAGADRFLELGPGSVLGGLNRRNARGTPTRSVGEPEHLDRLEELQAAVED